MSLLALCVSSQASFDKLAISGYTATTGEDRLLASKDDKPAGSI